MPIGMTTRVVSISERTATVLFPTDLKEIADAATCVTRLSRETQRRADRLHDEAGANDLTDNHAK